MNKNAEKKVVVITGASGGVGKGAARYFLKNNYKAILIGRNINQLEKLKAEFSEELKGRKMGKRL